MFVALIASLASAVVELGDPWGEFSRRPALRGPSETVEIGTLGMNRQSQKLRYWLRYTRAERLGKVTTRWADSETCSEVTGILERMRGLAVPQPDPPGIGERGPTRIVLDGAGYSLRAPAQFGPDAGKFLISSNIETPLAQWTDDSLRRLERCWTDEQPKRHP